MVKNKKRVFNLRFFMREKKGLSQVVTVLIMILLSITLLAVVWAIIAKVISSQAELLDIQNRFFSEHIGLTKVHVNPNDGLMLDISLRKDTGTFSSDEEKIEAPPKEVHVVSVVDLSGSMRTCSGVSSICCQSTLSGDYIGGGECVGISDQGVSQCISSCGGSNLIDGLTPTREANHALVDTLFSREIDNNQIGISAYAGNVLSSWSSDLTEDNESIKNLIDVWGSGGSTCICCGINDAKDKLSGSDDDILKTLIVMSDGVTYQECPSRSGDHAIEDAIQAACDAYNEIENLTIYSVGLGGNVDIDTLDSIATQCGDGQSYSAENLEDLIGIYSSLANSIIKQSEKANKFAYIKVIFYDDSGNEHILEVDAPGPLETFNYNIDLTGTGLVAPIIKIEVYPVILTPSGNEVVGNLFDSWED